MRFYQMDADFLAKQLNSDKENGLTIQDENEKISFYKKTLRLIASVFRSIRSKVSFAAIIPSIFYFLTLVFSILNQEWSVLILAIVSLFITMLFCFLEELILLMFKKKHRERILKDEKIVIVVRNAHKMQISADQLKVGDLVCLSEGTILYADARMIQGDGIFAMEKMVFNTQIPAAKYSAPIEQENLPPEKQENMLWKGSYIHSGTGVCMVTAVNGDCYVEKTGGRTKKKHRSIFYRRQNNLGHWISFLCVVLTVVLFLIAAFITGRYIDAFLTLAAVTSLFLLNPVSALTQWTYYRTENTLYKQGVLIRNFEAFDQMQNEKDVCFNLDSLLKDNIALSHILPVEKSEEDCLITFALCNEGNSLGSAVRNRIIQSEIGEQAIYQRLIGSRRSFDSNDNVCGIFMTGSQSVAVVSGYWEHALDYVGEISDELKRHIDELEKHGNFVHLVAGRGCDDSIGFPTHGFRVYGLIVFAVSLDEKAVEMTFQLHRAGALVHLVNPYTKSFGDCMANLYDMDDARTVELINDAAVSADALPIKKKNANLIYNNPESYTSAIYQVKCMFCGLKRTFCFSAVFGLFMLFSAFIMFLSALPIETFIIPVLLMRFLLLAPGYFLIGSARNCNQFKRSLILGLFCGLSGFFAAMLKMEMTLLTMQISAVFLAVYLWVANRSFLKSSKQTIVLLIVLVFAVLIPWFFMAGNWMSMLLIALFAPLAAFVLDLFS